MSHNFLSADRFIEREDRKSGPAWHRLATPFAEDLKVSAVEACEQVGGKYDVIKCPNEIILPASAGGATIQTGEFTLVREPMRGDDEWLPLGTCSKAYEPVQNMALAELLDRGLTKHWRVETCGVLGRGERIFFVLKAGMFNPLGANGDASQEMELFYLLTGGKTPKDGINSTLTSIKTVCQNTLDLALDAADMDVRVRQVAGAIDRLEIVNDMYLALQQNQEAAKAALERLARLKIKTADARKIFRAAFPDPYKPGALKLWEKSGGESETLEKNDAYIGRKQHRFEYRTEQMNEYRLAAEEMFGRINEQEHCIANTAWAAVNAVTEMDYIVAAQHRDSLPESMIFGKKATRKAAALKAALSIKG